MGILTVIPAFNEATTIAALVRGITSVLPEGEVVVVDDGSNDDTGLIARHEGAMVLRPPFNLGIGGAVQTGLMLVSTGNYEYIIRLDGDGQHPPEEIPILLKAVCEGEADIAVGSRFFPRSQAPPISLNRRIGIFLFSKMASFFSGQTVTDPTSGFMVMTREVAIFLSKNLSQDYPEVDARVLLARGGFKVREYPTRMLPRQGGVSSIDLWHACYYALKVTLSIMMARNRTLKS